MSRSDFWHSEENRAARNAYHLAWQKCQRKDPDRREKLNARRRARYAKKCGDPEFQAKKRAAAKRFLARNPGYQEAIQRKRLLDPRHRAIKNHRQSIRRGVLNSHYSRNRQSEILGCSYPFFIAYLASKFKPGMSWANYGSYWEIDHIIPVSSFKIMDEREQRQCFHYTNLQPLTGDENRRKASKIGP